jgi:hypothetical protein
VDFLNGTSVIASAAAAPYTQSWTNVPAGSYTLSARATESTGATVTSAPVTVTVVPPSSTSVVFRGSDPTIQGSWQGRYGSQGYGLVNDTLAYPAYAQVTVGGANSYTWAGSTTDPRALQRATGSGRQAACWYASGNFTLGVTLTDGLAHQVALYLLDWDALARTQRIDVLDSVSGAVLDTRSIAAFQGGQYLVWTVTGQVTFRVTNTAAFNGVVSGLFFDADTSIP